MKRYWAIIIILLAIIAACVVYIGRYVMREIAVPQGESPAAATDVLSSVINGLFKNTEKETETPTEEIKPVYRLYSADTLVGEFDSLEMAREAGQRQMLAAVVVDAEFDGVFSNDLFDEVFLWENYHPFIVTVNGVVTYGSDEAVGAMAYARNIEGSEVFFRGSASVIWSNTSGIVGHQIADVPLIGQNPELPRGCEVTSLAMLMDYYGADVDKTVLAKEIAKDETPVSYIDGKKHFGNPNTGFVGDMYNLDNDGLGVYHSPVYDLLRNYFPDTGLDVTGCEFSDLYGFIDRDMPVWIIVTSRYRWLEPSFFKTWSTPIGDIDVTYQEHSVVITGYDDDYIYINDPFLRMTSLPKADFIAGWEQLGKQAIIIAK